MAKRNYSRNSKRKNQQKVYRKTVGKTNAEKRGKFRKHGKNRGQRRQLSYEGYSKAVDILHSLYLNEVKYHELSPMFQNIGKMLQTNKWLPGHQKQQFFYFLKDILRPGNVPVLYQHNILYVLFKYRRHWLRNPEGWKPTTYWDAAQGVSWGKVHPQLIQELINHLFVKYPVPAFMHQAWDNNDHQHILWFIFLAKGHNLRRVKSVPAKLTTKMAHYFTKAPSYYAINQALLYGQVRGLGGSVALSDELYKCSVQRIQRDTDFFAQLVQFLMRYPELVDQGELPRIVNFINARKYYGQRIYTREGGIKKEPATDPGFTLQKRTPKSLLKLVNDWHEALNILGDEFKASLVSWEVRKKQDFEYQPLPFLPRYRITQLINNYELWLEGKVMSHCVGGYAYKCQDGTSSIWAMSRIFYDGREEKCLTIELGDEDKIWEVRGKQNREPTDSELSIIQHWSKQENLELPIDYA